MKAAFLTGLREMEIREAPDPKIKHGKDVLLRVDVVGVCGSDVHYYKTGSIGSQVVEFPWVLGHEAAGTVLEVGPEVSRLKKGDRVAIDPAMPCGECDQCRAGRANTCRNLSFLACPGQAAGALVEYLVMPETSCVPVPDGMTLEEAAFVEPLSIGEYARRLAGADRGATAAVLGAGPIGLSVLLSARAAGYGEIHVTDLLDERLRVAARLGAVGTGNPRREDIVAAVIAREPLGVDCVFECAGEQETLDQGVELLKPGGVLVMVGIPEADRVSFSADKIRRKELRLQNVRRQLDCVVPALELIASGRVKLGSLFTHRFPLEETKEAFDMIAAYRDGAVKALIRISGEN